METEVTGSGRDSKMNGGGVSRGSVWETRMRIDQVKGGIKVFGVFDEEEVAEQSLMKGSQEEEDEQVSDKNSIPMRRIGARAGRRRTWQPQQEAFEGPLQVGSRKPDVIQQSIPVELPKIASESNCSPQRKDLAELRRQKLEFLHKAASKIGNGVGSGESLAPSENGSAEKFVSMNSKKKPTATSPVDRPKNRKPQNHQVGRFKIGPKVSELNHGGNNEEEEEEEMFFDIKEINVTDQKPRTPLFEENKVRVGLFNDKPGNPISSPATKQHPIPSPVSKLNVEKAFVKESSYECEHDPKGHKNIAQSIEDLLMWRDVWKSSAVFGLGTLIVVSSYMNDPAMCFVSTISYLGVAFFSAIYLYRSIIWSDYVDVDKTAFHELGEEELICLTKATLPYLNGFIRNWRALLSGDPATTTKLAVMFFVLARCGSFVTMWNMIRLGFFGAFSIPKLGSLYFTELTNQGSYWIKLSRDNWESYPHKKAIAGIVIVLILGFSSNFARIWTGLILVAAFLFFRHSLVRESSLKSVIGNEKSERRGQHSIHDFTKHKKVF